MNQPKDEKIIRLFENIRTAITNFLEDDDEEDEKENTKETS